MSKTNEPKGCSIECEKGHRYDRPGDLFHKANQELAKIAKRRNGTAPIREWSSVGQVDWCPKCLQEMLKEDN